MNDQNETNDKNNIETYDKNIDNNSKKEKAQTNRPQLKYIIKAQDDDGEIEPLHETEKHNNKKMEEQIRNMEQQTWHATIKTTP